ncbi:hypothetical protein ACHAXA_002258 [Cyclostephanos tholiformis]|uniref:Uncharacterized protein n=1 Tax=Cyclostephanos tholiformis TaxID=382380 RepID=A0ABD3R4F0_9STRA
MSSSMSSSPSLVPLLLVLLLVPSSIASSSSSYLATPHPAWICPRPSRAGGGSSSGRTVSPSSSSRSYYSYSRLVDRNVVPPRTKSSIPLSATATDDDDDVDDDDSPSPPPPEERTRTTTIPTTTTTPTIATPLSSAYDRDLPPSLVGEAVRSALRSMRGVCIDFAVDRYATSSTNDARGPRVGGGGGGGGGATSRSVNVVGMRGRGTGAFLNAKFSGTVPRFDDDDGGGDGGGATMASEKKGGSSSSSSSSLVRRGRAFETAYLTSRGRIIDRLAVLYFPPSNDGTDDDDLGGMEDAFLITSPGNDGDDIYDRLSRTIFPLDDVTISRYDRYRRTGGGEGGDDTTTSNVIGVITLACSTIEDANNMLAATLVGVGVGGDDGVAGSSFAFPEDGTCDHYRVPSSKSGDGASSSDVYAFRHTFLSPDICHGYTLLFRGGRDGNGSGGSSLADDVWRMLTDERNDVGPVGIGYLEYDTLRVEAGLPGYGNEMTGDGPTGKGRGGGVADADRVDDIDDDVESYYAKSNPLELHLRDLIDVDKGCYQGQEGVASVLKNKRGPPRQLYQVVFRDSENDFHGGGGGGGDDAGFGLLSTNNDMLTEFRKLKGTRSAAGGTAALTNDTRQPRPGDGIYVLGSNDSIPVGKITSVAEPNGTGDAKTIALALVKRPEPILSAIKEQGLELPRWWEDVGDDDDRNEDDGNAYDRRGAGRGGVIANEKGGSGIMRPPPLDPLHNLEIVIGGTYTVGRLVSVPGRRYGGRKSSRGGRDVAPLLDYESMGEVVTGGDADGPGYFRYDFQDDDRIREVATAAPSTNVSVPRNMETEVEGDLGEMNELLAEAKEDFAKAAAQAEAAAVEAQRKEEKMKIRCHGS